MASSRLSVPAKRGTRPAASVGRHLDAQHVITKPSRITAEQPGDGPLERPVAAALQRQQPERDDAGDHAAGEQRDPEQQVQRDAPPITSARSVAMATSSACTHMPARHPAREVVAAQLRQVAPGGQAELGRQRLDQHGQQVGRDDHPEQQVAVLGAGGEVGGEVAGVDVGDGGDERRPEQGEPAQPRARGSGGGRAGVPGCGHAPRVVTSSPRAPRGRAPGGSAARRAASSRRRPGSSAGRRTVLLLARATTTRPGTTPSSPR